MLYSRRLPPRVTLSRLQTIMIVLNFTVDANSLPLICMITQGMLYIIHFKIIHFTNCTVQWNLGAGLAVLCRRLPPRGASAIAPAECIITSSSSSTPTSSTSISTSSSLPQQHHVFPLCPVSVLYTTTSKLAIFWDLVPSANIMKNDFF